MYRFACAVACLLFFSAMPLPSASAQSGNDAAIYLTPDEIEEIRKGSACKTFVRQVVDLKKRMSAGGIETDFYDLRVIPTTELVKGKKGTYYAVYLRDARRKRRFQFPGGRYVIQRFDTRFRASLASFTREILAPIHGGLSYSLYVRGSASAKPMRRKRKLDRKFIFDEIAFAPLAGEEIYDANRSDTIGIVESYGNEELPYLRAAFLRKAIADTVPFATPTILDSVVSESKSREEQFAEILLFVEWN